MRRITTLPMALIALFALFALAACGNSTTGLPDTGEVQQRIDEPNGGFEMVDEQPAFDNQQLFASAALMDAQIEVNDELMDIPEVVQLSQSDPANGGVVPRRFVLVAVWGQPRLDWEVPTFTNWSGQISVNKGAVLARRTIRFDPEDALLARTDPKVLPFQSFTQPHHDGLVVNIFDNPDSPLAVQGQVEIQLAALPQSIVIPYDQLDGFRMLIPVDNMGNKLLIAAEEIPLGACQAGFLFGHWHRLLPGLGFFIGQWNGEAGALHGHLAGIYGVNANSEQVFFGKYIGVGGVARGILVGGYGQGHFAGIWHGLYGPEGVLGGIYHETIAGPETGGLFLGGWARTNCN